MSCVQASLAQRLRMASLDQASLPPWPHSTLPRCIRFLQSSCHCQVRAVNRGRERPTQLLPGHLALGAEGCPGRAAGFLWAPKASPPVLFLGVPRKNLMQKSQTVAAVCWPPASWWQEEIGLPPLDLKSSLLLQKLQVHGALSLTLWAVTGALDKAALAFVWGRTTSSSLAHLLMGTVSHSVCFLGHFVWGGGHALSCLWKQAYIVSTKDRKKRLWGKISVPSCWGTMLQGPCQFRIHCFTICFKATARGVQF